MLRAQLIRLNAKAFYKLTDILKSEYSREYELGEVTFRSFHIFVFQGRC
jgi:hypothetical protein